MRDYIKAKVIFVMSEGEEQSKVLSVATKADEHGAYGYANLDRGMYSPAKQLPIKMRKDSCGRDEYFIKIPKH